MRKTTKPRRLASLLLLAAGSLLTACASPSGSSMGLAADDVDAEAMRIRFVDYRDGLRLEIVNQAHTDRLELYSQRRDSASTKVASNRDVAALYRRFEDRGYFERARPGVAPSVSSTLSKSIEVETPEGTTFLTLPRGGAASVEEGQTFRALYSDFVALYNVTPQAQAVSNGSGIGIFQSSDSGQRPKR